MNDKLENNSELSPIDDERVSAYLDGALSEVELADFENLLRDSAEYRSAVDEMRQVSEAVRALPRLKLDAGFSERVMLKAQQATGVSHSSAGTSTTSVSRASAGSRGGWRSFVYVAATLAAALLVMQLSGYKLFPDVDVANTDPTTRSETFAIPESEQAPENRAAVAAKEGKGVAQGRVSVADEDAPFAEGDESDNGLGGVFTDDMGEGLVENDASNVNSALAAKPMEDGIAKPEKMAGLKALGAAEAPGDGYGMEGGSSPASTVKKALPMREVDSAPPAAPSLESIATDDRVNLRKDMPGMRDGKPADGLDRLGVVPLRSKAKAPKQTMDDSVLQQELFVAPNRPLVRYSEQDKHIEFMKSMNTQLTKNQGPSIDQVAVVSLPAKADIDFFFHKAKESGIQSQGLHRWKKASAENEKRFGTLRRRNMSIVGGGGMGGGGMGGSVAEGTGGVISAGNGDRGSALGGRGYGGGTFGAELKELDIKENSEIKGRDQDNLAVEELDSDADGEIESESVEGMALRGAQILGAKAPALAGATLSDNLDGIASVSNERGRAYYFGDAKSADKSGEQVWDDEQALDANVEKNDLALLVDSNDDFLRSMKEPSLAYGRQQGQADGGEYVLVEAPPDVMLEFFNSLDSTPAAVWYAERTGAPAADFGNEDPFKDDVEIMSAAPQPIENMAKDLPVEAQAASKAETGKQQTESQLRFSVSKIEDRNQLQSAFGLSEESKVESEPGKLVRILFYLPSPAAAVASEAAVADDEIAPAIPADAIPAGAIPAAVTPDATQP